MSKRPFLSTKSIPTFTLVLPIVSLLTLTLFFMYILKDIEKDLLHTEEATITKVYEESLDALLASRITSAHAFIDAIVDSQLTLFKNSMQTLIIAFEELAAKERDLTEHFARFNRHTVALNVKMDSKATNCHFIQKLDSDNLLQLIQEHDVICIESKNYPFHFELYPQLFLAQIKQMALKGLEKTRFSQNEYLFVYHTDGTLLTHPIYPQAVGQNFLEIQEQNSSDLFAQMTKNTQGSFFTQKAHKPSTQQLEEKRFFSKVYKPFNWIVTTGVYNDDIRNKVETLKADSSRYFSEKTGEILLVILLVFSIILLLSLIVSNLINTLFKRFTQQIENQNETLRKFNKELTLTVEQKTQELKRSESRYRTIFERSRDAVFIIDEKRITYLNDAALTLFERGKKADLLGMNILELLSGGDEEAYQIQLLKDYLAIANALGFSHFEWKLKRLKKFDIYIDVWLQRITLENKDTIHAVLRDISAQKMAEAKVKDQHQQLQALNLGLEERVQQEVIKNQQKEKMLLQQSRLAQMGEMISMIAHQWRQPLSAITTSSAHLKLLIALNTHTDEKLDEGLNQIDEYVQHLSETINDFRNFFRPDRAKEETTLYEIVTKSLTIIRPSLQNLDITLELQGDQNQTITTYPHEVMQVVLNILKNAEDVIKERVIKDPSIAINWHQEDRYYLLSFHDNAGGIQESIIDKVFDPYFSTKDKKNGTGLGLYMSKVIISEHCQGELHVMNEEDGATFIIKLPLSI